MYLVPSALDARDARPFLIIFRAFYPYGSSTGYKDGYPL